jgi:hypothetical protein
VSNDVGLGLIQGDRNVKPPPLGKSAIGLSLKPALIALSIAPTMVCPDICAIFGVTGDLHFAQLDAVNRDADGLRQC